MIVTPAQAGFQFKVAWIPVFAGMTNRYHNAVHRNIYDNISGTQHYKFPLFSSSFAGYISNCNPENPGTIPQFLYIFASLCHEIR